MTSPTEVSPLGSRAAEVGGTRRDGLLRQDRSASESKDAATGIVRLVERSLLRTVQEIGSERAET